MAKKQILTRSEIEKDIINVFKQPQEMSESSYKKWTIPSVIIACIEFIYPIFILWVVLALVIFLIASSIISRFRLKRHIKNVSIDDYEIKTEVVANTTEESYVKKGPKWHSKRVNNYTIRFENGESWRIPEDNYPWSKERRMSGFAIFQSTHRGDVFMVVIKKDTGKIVVAYNTEFFEYKNNCL